MGRRYLPRDGQFELFDALASADKRLIARPGPHDQTHPDDEASWQDFLTLNTPPRVTDGGSWLLKVGGWPLHTIRDDAV